MSNLDKIRKDFDVDRIKKIDLRASRLIEDEREDRIKVNIFKKKEYLDVTYMVIKSDYPNQLAKHIKENIFKDEGTLLDVGCGNGDYLKAFSKLGYDVCGIDLSPAIKELEFKTKIVNLEKKYKSSKQYDFIFTKSVIEHIKNVDNFVESMYNNLKDEGKIVIMTPAWEYTYSGPFYRDHTHVTPFTKESLENILKIHNFKNVEVKYFYQLPIVWKFSLVKYFSKLINWLKIPYKNNKFVKFSREVMLMAVARK